MNRLLAFFTTALFSCTVIAQEATVPSSKPHHGTIITRNIVSNGPLTLNTAGTTTTGSAVGALHDSSADYYFNINGARNFQITDNWWNPNISYQGPPTAWLVASGGALAGGPDNIAVLGCASSIYGPGTPGTATGCTEMFMPRGTSGNIHFSNNGGIGEVSIGPPQGTNPNGTDAYALTNQLWLGGSFTGSGFDPVVYTQYAQAGDSARGLLLYNEGTGGFRFEASNTASNIAQFLESTAADVNGLTFTSAATGSNPSFGINAFNGYTSPDTNVGFNFVSRGTGNDNWYSGTTLLMQLEAPYGASTTTQPIFIAGSGYAEMEAGNGTNPLLVLSYGSGNGSVQIAGHLSSAVGTTSSPGTPTSCGTGSPSVVGTDTRGTITTGAAASTCTLPFGTAYASAPYCVVSDNSLVGFASVTSTSTSNMILGISAALTGGKITYICIQ